MPQNKLLTNKALKVMAKKLQNKRLTQQDSNYLSRFVRPKLRAMASINAEALLKQLEYSPKARAIERKIKRIVARNVPLVDSIIICGSAVQTNYKEYNDIDVIIATKKVITEGMKEKYKLISKIEDDGKKAGLILDVQIYAKKSILDQYPHNPSLIYQLKDSKVIYGRFQLPRKISLSNLDLKMKLDWSEIVTKSSEAKEVYDAIRNAMLVLLLMNKKVDNGQLRMNVMNVLGADLISKLKSNKASPLEKKLSLSYLTLLTGYLEEELNKPQWEKIELENL